jgi:hypothetical protein
LDSLIVVNLIRLSYAARSAGLLCVQNCGQAADRCYAHLIFFRSLG